MITPQSSLETQRRIFTKPVSASTSTMQAWAEFVRQAQQVAAAKRQPAWLPGDLSVVFSVAATIEILAWWLKQNEPPSVKRMAEILDRLVVIPSLAQSVES
jgi:predicted signal transduction protein with EAL and GGDEF domain